MKRIFETPEEEHYFFGYYDKSPLNGDSSRLLAQRTPFTGRMPEAGDSIEIGYFDFPDGQTFHPIANTLAWNWQQGSMLQWTGPDFDSGIIFNDIRDGQYVSVRVDIESGTEKILPMPVYTVTGDGKWGLCIDYDRLYWFHPGYNYQGHPKPDKKSPIDPDDGIWRMCLESGETVKIISIQDVLGVAPVSMMRGATHYLEHLMMSPSDERFCFLHNFSRVDGGIFSRLFTAKLDGSELSLVADSGRIGHFCWRDDSTIFAYAGMKTVLNSLRRHKEIAKFFIRPLLPVYHSLFPPGGAVARKVTGDGYMLCDALKGGCRQITTRKPLANGHPSFRPGNRNIFVNDAYPDEQGNCPLYLYDLAAGQMLDEMTITTDRAIRTLGYRCDLHPKWSFDGQFVSIDVATERGRRIDVYEMRRELK